MMIAARRLWLAALVAVFVPLALSAGPVFAQDPQVVPEPRPANELANRPAFPFTLTDTNGETQDQRAVQRTPYALLFVRTDCRVSRQMVQDAVDLLEERASMHLVVVVLDPSRVGQDRPTPLMNAQNLRRTLIADSAAADRVIVGLPSRDVVTSYGSLVYGEQNQVLRDVPILLAIDANGTIRGAAIGSATEDQLSGGFDAAIEASAN